MSPALLMLNPVRLFAYKCTMKKLLLAVLFFLPFKTTLASHQGGIQVTLTIVAPPLPPRISEVRISEDRMLIVHEW